MCVTICVCAWMCVGVHVCACVCECMYMWICISVRVCVCVCVCECVCVCLWMRVKACVHVCAWVCASVCMLECTCKKNLFNRDHTATGLIAAERSDINNPNDSSNQIRSLKWWPDGLMATLQRHTMPWSHQHLTSSKPASNQLKPAQTSFKPASNQLQTSFKPGVRRV